MTAKLGVLKDEFARNMKQYKWFILFVLGYLLYFFIAHPGETNCLIKHTIGLPCPMCGMTRASVQLLQFDFVEAFRFHPLVFLMPFLFVVMLFKGLHPINKLYNSKIFWGMIFLMFLGLYVYRMGTMFPNIPPMDIKPDSILEILLD